MVAKKADQLEEKLQGEVDAFKASLDEQLERRDAALTATLDERLGKALDERLGKLEALIRAMPESRLQTQRLCQRCPRVAFFPALVKPTVTGKGCPATVSLL